MKGIMKKLFFLAIMLVMCFSVEAQTQSQVKQQISRAAAQLRSMQCDFVQTKHVKMLNQNVVSTGKMYYQRSDKLRWEYVTPYKYSFILNGSKVKINGPRRSDVINVQRNKVFKEIANIMMSSVVGNCLTDTGSFNVSIAAGKTEWVATLLPQRKEMKQMFQNIKLYFNKQNSMVTKVELTEKNGDGTVIVLKNVKANVSIPANTFRVA